jgi:hypothetical protein
MLTNASPVSYKGDGDKLAADLIEEEETCTGTEEESQLP